MKKVYLDNAATTQLLPEVISSMHRVLLENYGNPSSTHSIGRSAKTLIEVARKQIAKRLNALPSEIIFTSGGTEADNMVLRSVVCDLKVQTIITSKIEHHAVLNTVKEIKNEYGINVKYVNLDPEGRVQYKHLETLLAADKSKKLVSLMHVNNEIGNILDINRVAQLCSQNNALFHSDTVQSIGHLPIDAQQTKVDFMAAAAHKFHGPKGIGFAYIRKNTGLKPLIYGGQQERGYRGGTESVHNIDGLLTAFNSAYDNLEEDRQYIQTLKNHFIKELSKALPEVSYNGSCLNHNKSAYNMVNVCLPFSPEKALILLFHLDLKGISCSKGSACQSGGSQGSYVLKEILSESAQQRPSLRFSFSKFNTIEELDYVVGVLKEFADK